MRNRLLRIVAMFLCALFAHPTPGLAKKANCITCKAARTKKKLQTRTAPIKSAKLETQIKAPLEEPKIDSIKADVLDELFSLETRGPVRTITMRHNLHVFGDTTFDGTTTLNGDISAGDCKTFSVDKIDAKSQDYVTMVKDLA